MSLDENELKNLSKEELIDHLTILRKMLYDYHKVLKDFTNVFVEGLEVTDHPENDGEKVYLDLTFSTEPSSEEELMEAVTSLATLIQFYELY